jgi:hypothetical protein
MHGDTQIYASLGSRYEIIPYVLFRVVVVFSDIRCFWCDISLGESPTIILYAKEGQWITR